MIEFMPVGGYSEFGRNMTAIKIDDEVVVIDMGLHMSNYIALHEAHISKVLSTTLLQRHDAIPDFQLISHWAKKVKAIIPTHAHLDHIGAIPFISKKFNADIICSPFTGEVLRAILKDDRRTIPNKIRTLSPNSTYQISKNIELQFISITHSTPEAVLVVIKTKYGNIVYSNDFKLDMTPTLGKAPDLKKIGDIGNVIAYIADCTNAKKEGTAPSESDAKEQLGDILHHNDFSQNGIIVTTFSSHIARLKAIVEYGRQLNRKVVFLGRSLSKYVEAAKSVGLYDFADVEIIRFKPNIMKKLNQISKNRSQYLTVVTGHQGEPQSVLSRMVDGGLKYHFKKDDVIIFSCRIIPNEINYAAREILENKLLDKKQNMYTDVHASGHGSKNDLTKMINLLKPKYFIPSHGESDSLIAFKDLVVELGYSEDSVKIVKNGDLLKLNPKDF